MKKILLIAILSSLLACNSKKTNDTKVSEEKQAMDSPSTVKDTTPPTTNVPSGKIDIETFGAIKIGQSYTDMNKVLGQPDSKAEAIEWAADGLMHQDWTWKSKGLVLNMAYDKTKPEGTTTIHTITATAPCAYKTRAGMGIGSTYQEVEQAYKRDIDPEATDKTQITVGSVYGGIIFSFKNNKAEKIFLGAEAE